jgi:type 1 glutamine amidotransferase
MKKAIALVILIGFVQAQTPKKGGGPPSESVRPAASRRVRTAVSGLLGWSVGVRSTALGQLTFFEAAVKTDALGLAYIEGYSTQKVSPQIAKNLDNNLTPDEIAAVRTKLRALNLRMPAYHVDTLPTDEPSRRKLFEFAKSLGAETIVSTDTSAPVDQSTLTVRHLGERGANLARVLLELAKSAPPPQEQPEKCSNCGRPYGGVKPMLLTIDPAAVEDFEKAARPAMGYRVDQISHLLPITSSDRVPPDERQKIEAALPKRALVKPKKPRKLLVIDLCPAGGYYHTTIAHANLALQLMAKNTGAYEPVFSNDLNNLKYDKIKQFDAVFLNSTVGEVFPDPGVLNGLTRFVREGGGLAGIHGASYASMDLPEFSEMIGAADGPHRVETATLKIDDPKSPLTKGFAGKGFVREDEFYHFLPDGPFSRERLHVLISIDTEKSDMSQWHVRPDNDYGLTWIRSYGRGRVFNCAMGHTPTLFATPALAEHILAAIQFVLGDLEADTTPSAKLKR